MLGMNIRTYNVRLGVCFLLVAFLSGCHTGYYRGPVSDHFDGKKFHYPGEEHGKAHPTYHLLTLLIAILNHPWPKNVPEIHYSNLPTYPKDAKITFINHSTVLIQTNSVNFLIDPIYSYRASPFQWIGPYRAREPGVKFIDLPKIDVVLISHNHYDHMDLPTIKHLNKVFHPLFVVPLGNKKYLQYYGIEKVIELDWWQDISYKNTKITFLPAKHDAQRWLHDYNRTLWGSFGIDAENKKIYFAGDSAYAKHFKDIRKRWGRPDFSCIPIGAYEPRHLQEDCHVDPIQAAQIHLDLESKASIGIHWGTFQLAAEGIDTPVIDLDRARKKYNIPERDFFVIQEGSSIYLP